MRLGDGVNHTLAIYRNQNFAVFQLRSTVVPTQSLVALTEASIIEHIEKARRKIEACDNAGAISNAYTLVESFLKALLRKIGEPYKETEGDIRELYKAVSVPLGLSAKGDNLETYLKTILDGLKKQLAGLYEVANKASDRHDRKYNPARHHAKLAVNSALTLCEFLLDSYDYQEARKKRAANQ